MLDIQTVGFEDNAVVVTIKGIKTEKYLAAADRGSKVYLTKDLSKNVRWQLIVDKKTKQDLYKNSDTGYVHYSK